MTRFLCVLACLILFPVACLAAEIKAVDVTGVADGRYVLTIVGDTITITPLNLISTGPVPPPVPDPDTLTVRAKAIRDAAKSLNDPETCQKMAMLFDEIAKLVDTGKLAGQTKIALMMSKAQGMVLGDKVTSWKPVTGLISTDWTKMVQEGAKDVDYANYLREARDGLRAAAPEQMIDPKWIELIMQIIMLILQLIG